MAPPSVYADATALIGLGRIDRLDLLAVLPGPVKVTGHVWAEVADDPHKPGVAALRAARDTGLLVVVNEGDPDAFPQLDAGESTVLSAAMAVHAVVVIDERKARRLVETDPTVGRAVRAVIGIVGLSLLAKRRGKVPLVRPLLDALIDQGFWIGASFYDGTLRQAGERSAS